MHQFPTQVVPRPPVKINQPDSNMVFPIQMTLHYLERSVQPSHDQAWLAACEMARQLYFVASTQGTLHELAEEMLGNTDDMEVMPELVVQAMNHAYSRVMAMINTLGDDTMSFLASMDESQTALLVGRNLAGEEMTAIITGDALTVKLMVSAEEIMSWAKPKEHSGKMTVESGEGKSFLMQTEVDAIFREDGSF